MAYSSYRGVYRSNEEPVATPYIHSENATTTTTQQIPEMDITMNGVNSLGFVDVSLNMYQRMISPLNPRRNELMPPTPEPTNTEEDDDILEMIEEDENILEMIRQSLNEEPQIEPTNTNESDTEEDDDILVDEQPNEAPRNVIVIRQSEASYQRLINPPTFSQSISSMERILQQSLNDVGNRYKRVISDEAREALKEYRFGDRRTETDISYSNVCCITQEEFQQDDIVIELPCKHCFMKDAIMHWLENENSVCPVCRHQLGYKEVREEDIQHNTETQDTEEEQEDISQHTDTVSRLISILERYVENPNTQEEDDEEEEQQQPESQEEYIVENFIRHMTSYMNRNPQVDGIYFPNIPNMSVSHQTQAQPNEEDDTEIQQAILQSMSEY